MNREILFRGKTKQGEWVYGDLLRQYGVTEIYVDTDTLSEYDLPNYLIIPETVGQFTGLTDKNGKKVFEGDIVEFLDRDKFKWKGVVVYQEEYALYLVKANSVWAFGFFDMDIKRVEVIGNIHDNKELLGE